MVEIVSKNGKKLGHLADSMDETDELFIDGKKVSLEDTYSNTELRKAFNDHVKEYSEKPNNTENK